MASKEQDRMIKRTHKLRHWHSWWEGAWYFQNAHCQLGVELGDPSKPVAVNTKRPTLQWSLACEAGPWGNTLEHQRIAYPFNHSVVDGNQLETSWEGEIALRPRDGQGSSGSGPGRLVATGRAWAAINTFAFGCDCITAAARETERGKGRGWRALKLLRDYTVTHGYTRR
ncbi:hypothetical protein VTK56DRAFT_3903 [Thermocarpiscus australiensis]